MIGLLLVLCAHGLITSGQVISVAELSGQSQAGENEGAVTKRGAVVIQNGRPDANFGNSQPSNPLDHPPPVPLPKSERGSGSGLHSDSPVAQVNVIQVYVAPGAKRRRRLRAFDHLPGCPNDAIQFIKTTNFDGSLKQHVFRTAFAINTDECANLCHTHYFCHSAGYQPTSNRCLLSYKRSNIICDWSAAPTRIPSLSDDIRPSSWLLQKGKDDQDDAFEDEIDDDDSDVWLDCFRCGIVFGVNGTNATITFVNGSVVDVPKHEFDIGNYSASLGHNATFNETEIGHSIKAASSHESLNSTSINGTHLNETDLLLLSTAHGNASLGNVTDLGHVNASRVNETVFGHHANVSDSISFNDTISHNLTASNNETRVNLSSPVGNHSSLINETIALLAGNDTYSTYHIIFTLAPVNGSNEHNLTADGANSTHLNESSRIENDSVHSRNNVSSENATLHLTLSQENNTLHLNQSSNQTLHQNATSELNSTLHLNLTSAPTLTLHQNLATTPNATVHSNTSELNLTSHHNTSLETLHILNATVDSDHHPNVTLDNATEHAHLISDNSSLHHNLTLAKDSGRHNLTVENGTFVVENATIHANLSSENATLHHVVALDNATLLTNLTAENVTHSSNLTSENTTVHLVKANTENITDHNATSFPHAFDATLSSLNVTEGDHNLTVAFDRGNATVVPLQLLNVTSETPSAENATVPFSVTTRRARKYTRRPYTRHVEIVGNFSSAAGAYVGGAEQGF